jgi:DNA polymerase III delta prime subunit
LFYGNDIEAQYELATEIARLLNCHEYRNENCQCLNCKWIRHKEHPEVMTVSKIDSKPSDDDSKTVISVKQAQMVKNSLLNTSDYHRVFIFCDAEIEKGTEKWIPLGLSVDNFNEESANALLKTIEEPPANTTFFFLTRDKRDVLETIISRSQSFFVPSFAIEDRDYSSVSKILADYPNIERQNSLDLALDLHTLAKEKGVVETLDEVQNFLYALLKSNIDVSDLKLKILKDLKIVEDAKRQLKEYINPQLAIENMCLNFTSN